MGRKRSKMSEGDVEVWSEEVVVVPIYQRRARFEMGFRHVEKR